MAYPELFTERLSFAEESRTIEVDVYRHGNDQEFPTMLLFSIPDETA